MQDNRSRFPITRINSAAEITRLSRIADSHALIFDFVLGPEGLRYVLRDRWTGVTDCGPASLPEIAIHLGYYEEQRARERAEGLTL